MRGNLRPSDDRQGRGALRRPRRAAGREIRRYGSDRPTLAAYHRPAGSRRRHGGTEAARHRRTGGTAAGSSARQDGGLSPMFSPFERLVAMRYLRARRKEGFISVIAGFSFLGIMLGVATLIIVMAVMNGFRKELLDKILGLNGHLLVQPLESPLTDWKDVSERISQVAGIRLAAPVVDGMGLANSPFNASGVLIRGIRADDLNQLASVSGNIQQGTLEG